MEIMLGKCPLLPIRCLYIRVKKQAVLDVLKKKMLILGKKSEYTIHYTCTDVKLK